MNTLLRRRAALVVVAAALGLAACSRSGDDLAAPVAATVAPSSVVAGLAPDDTPDDDSPPAAPTVESEVAAQSSSTAGQTLPPTNPPISVVDVAEVGTPGLDSEDAFCSSWSRFAGSFQVVAVTAAFGSGPPEDLAALEVAAAPTVTRAYDDLFENWPDELAEEEELVADQFLGPFARRLAAAELALRDAGASGSTITTISEAWLAGLAQRDPSTPEFVVDLSDEAWATIDAAAALFGEQRVPFGSDPSLVTNVRTPLTDAYLAVSCPDQGTLSGQEVATP